MCGIAGFELRGEDAPSVTAALLAAMRSRGPDGGWWRPAANWALAQTRLAVIDLSPQVTYPMPNESGDVWLLFNGEIYNHDVLRRELEAAGHRFATRCDAEVAVHGYEEWGTGVFRRLSGMWAIALVDERERELLLARDPRGIKPLVRTTGDRFGFGSDALALVQAGLSRGEIDREAIAEYAAFHYVPPPLTGLTDVRQVEPGTVVRRDARGRERVERWAGAVFADEPSTPPVALDEADEVLRGAVRRQLRADVPVGVFLSGGLDSALVLHYAVEVGARPVALTMGFADAGDYDETRAARATAQRLGVDHQVGTLTGGFAETVEGVAAAYDMPFGDPSAIATLPLAALARRYVTVALSGTGGDDLFAGYYRHRVPWLQRPVAALPARVAGLLGRLDPGRGAERASRVSLARSYAARLALSRGNDAVRLYLDTVGSSTSPAAWDLLLAVGSAEAARRRVARRYGLDGPASVAGIQEFELRTYLPGDLLVKEDRATMAHSVEGRVPLLDDAVVALAARTPLAQRTNLLAGKRLLRAIARRRLPRSYAARRKRGFAVPLARMLATSWHAEALDWLNESLSQLVDGRALAGLVGDSVVSAQDVWALSQLAAWESRLARLSAESRASTPKKAASKTPG